MTDRDDYFKIKHEKWAFVEATISEMRDESIHTITITSSHKDRSQATYTCSVDGEVIGTDFNTIALTLRRGVLTLLSIETLPHSYYEIYKRLIEHNVKIIQETKCQVYGHWHYVYVVKL